MVVRVTVMDADAAAGLMARLAREVELEDVSFDVSRQQVLLEVEKNPDQTLVRILNLVEQWLGADGRAPTDVEIDDHRYVLGA
jgi:predicted secreted protein